MTFLPSKTIHCPINSALEFINYFKLPYYKDADCLENLARVQNWHTPYDLRQKAKEIGITIIVTNTDQEIVWVSNYFESMTGYEINEAIGQTPRFLQGEKTCKQTNIKVRESIKSRKPFNGSLLNYKKDGSIYECNVQINPIFDQNNHLKNFIAFERER